MAAFNTLGAATVAIAAVIVVAFIRRQYFHPLGKIPGPWYTNWSSIVHLVQTLRGVGPIYVDNLHKKYGPVVRVGPSLVDVTDVETVKKIHRVKADFTKADFYRGIPPGAENLFNTQDLQFHRRHRKLLSAPLSESNLKALQPQIEEHVKLAVEKMGDEMKSRKAVDVCKWWTFMTTDVIGQLTFGESFHMLESGQVNRYIEDLQLAGIVGSVGSQLGSAIMLNVPLPFVGSYKSMQKRMSQYAANRLQRLRDALEGEAQGKQALLLSRLVQGQTVDGESLTDEEMRNDAELYIVAGSDTTSNSLTYITWAVCKQPKLRDRLVKEVQSLPEGFSDDDLKHLPFLSNCITEGLRRFPVVPAGLQRSVPQEGSSIGGHWLPGGATVMTQNWSLHRNPDIFADPDAFNPSRWENPTKSMKDSMLAFGGGSRVCIGMHLAYIELRMGLAHFFRSFPNSSVSTREGMNDDDMKQALHFVSSPQHHRCLIDAA
ncbi:cytochrome P450 [Xylariaceae sp. FL1272]|nr:cytochrome P450 [Xylariaceae sp. FL1272]